MTEEDWLACDAVGPLLRAVRQGACDRKFRLAAAARARRAGRLDAVLLRAVEAAERLADGLCTVREFVLAWRAAGGPTMLEFAGVGRHAVLNGPSCLDGLLPSPNEDSLRNKALLRDLFGPLPFRPVRLDSGWLTWQGGTVGHLARSIYKEGRFECLPVLADALEEAGCTDAALLAHCRINGGHVKGCWVLDHLLGHRAGAVRVTVADRDCDEVVADCLAAGSAVLCQADGRLEDLLSHPGLDGVGRLELDFGDDLQRAEGLEEADLQALESVGSLSPLKVICLPDGGESVERVIRLLATLPDAGGLETLILYWNYWNPSLAGARQRLMASEAEIDRLVGKAVCLIEPIEHC
jgi:hypothetical protein